MNELATRPTGDDDRGPKSEEFLKLLEANECSLFAYIYALTLNLQDADEVMQRVRIRAWQQFDQYDADRPFDAWLRAIAYYLVLAYRKEKSRQPEFFTERILEAISQCYEERSDPPNERRDALLKCIEKLDQRQRELVSAYYSSGRQRSKSIASELSMTPNALRQAVYRIRKVLLACVERTLQAESRT